jgi:hypothetical protein
MLGICRPNQSRLGEARSGVSRRAGLCKLQPILICRPDPSTLERETPSPYWLASHCTILALDWPCLHRIPQQLVVEYSIYILNQTTVHVHLLASDEICKMSGVSETILQQPRTRCRRRQRRLIITLNWSMYISNLLISTGYHYSRSMVTTHHASPT